MKPRIPNERYSRDVVGLPVFAATAPFDVFVGPESMAQAIPQDDEHCAIAKGCKEQLKTPYVSVGRSRTDLAMPHPNGVRKPGFGNTKWAVIRFKNSPKAKEIIIAADTGTLTGDGEMVHLLPAKASLLPAVRKERNKKFRQTKGIRDGRGKHADARNDVLTTMGVRKLTGQRRQLSA